MQYNISYREKDGSWQYIISYKLNGKWKQKSKQGFPLNRKGKQEAKDSALNALDKLKENIDLKSSSDFDGITFGKFTEQYLEHSKLYRSYKTVESTKTVLTKFSNLNSIPIEKITVLDIQKIIDIFINNELNSNTIRYYFKKLKIIFNAAKKQYGISNSIDFANIKLPNAKDTTKKALTDAEINHLLDEFKNTQYYLFIYIAINTGMRVGEIFGLTWEDIDFKHHLVHVNKQRKQGLEGYEFGELKSKNSYRYIPISQKVSDEISSYKKVTNIDNRIIVAKNKTTFIRAINRNLKKQFNISAHELRHTYATKLIANGLDFKTAAKILGHDVQETIRIYSHVTDQMFKDAQNLIENIF